MILAALRDYVIAHPHCTVADVAKHFSLSEDGVEAMMTPWVKRGKLKIILSERRGRTEKKYLWVNDEIGITVLS